MAVSIEQLAAVWSAVFGVCVGSFLNVVIFRTPRGFSVRRPSRSMCMSCHKRLRWHENIPVVSYLALRGKCGHCGTRIHPRYLVVEVLTALLAVAVYLFFGLSFATLYYFAMVAILLAITFIDIDHRIIPDALSFPGMALGLAGSLWIEHGLLGSVLGLAVGGGAFFALAWTYEKITGREGLGFGDVKLLAMIGAFLGVKGVALTVILSSFLGSILGLTLMVIQRKDFKMAIPFGPFLAIGAILALFWGDSLVVQFYPWGG